MTRFPLAASPRHESRPRSRALHHGVDEAHGTLLEACPLRTHPASHEWKRECGALTSVGARGEKPGTVAADADRRRTENLSSLIAMSCHGVSMRPGCRGRYIMKWPWGARPLSTAGSSIRRGYTRIDIDPTNFGDPVSPLSQPRLSTRGLSSTRSVTCGRAAASYRHECQHPTASGVCKYGKRTNGRARLGSAAGGSRPNRSGTLLRAHMPWPGSPYEAGFRNTIGGYLRGCEILESGCTWTSWRRRPWPALDPDVADVRRGEPLDGSRRLPRSESTFCSCRMSVRRDRGLARRLATTTSTRCRAGARGERRGRLQVAGCPTICPGRLPHGQVVGLAAVTLPRLRGGHRGESGALCEG